MPDWIARILGALVALSFAALVFFGLKSCADWVYNWPANIAHRQQIEAEKLPRKVNEAGGCEVWAFKPGDRWLYFTKCGSKTETTNTWDECRTVSQGKTSRTECTPRSTVIAQEPK